MSAYDRWKQDHPDNYGDKFSDAVDRKVAQLMRDQSLVRDTWDHITSEDRGVSGVDVAAALYEPETPYRPGTMRADRIDRALRLLQVVERLVANELEDRAQAEVIREGRESQEDAAMAAAGL